MAFKFKAVARKNPGDPAAAPKFYPSPVYSGNTTIRQLAKKISDISTVSSIDTLAVLEAFLQLIPEELINGQIVKLGDFGSFRLTLRGEGTETADALSSNQITKASVYFRPSKEFSDIANKIKSIKTSD